MHAETSGPAPKGPPNRRRKVIAAAIAILILAIILLLLLLRSCDRPQTPQAAAFDYFDAQAQALGRDRGKVLAWARGLKDLPYRGDARGPLATLWHGAGSPEEKLALAQAVVRHCSDSAAPQLADVSGAAAAPDAAAGTLRILHRGSDETLVWEGPVAALVGDGHTVVTTAPGTTRITLRAAADTVKDIAVGQAPSEALVFELRSPVQPADAKPRRIQRELWHADNATGPSSAAAGDRHDFVVLPCRVGPYVREKEELLLAQRGQKDSPHVKGYLGLLDYALLSDSHLASLEKRMGVQAGFDLPRILVLSTLTPPNGQGSWHAIDLRLNRPGFVGPPAKAYEATMVRSYAEAGLEHHFLTTWTKQPCTSAHDVFSRLKDDYPNTPERRLVLMAAAAEALRQHGGADGKVTFTARSPAGAARPGAARAVVSRTAGRLQVTAEGVDADLIARMRGDGLAETARVEGGRLSGTVEDASEAALLAELAMMAGGSPATTPDYVLQIDIDTGNEPLVVDAAQFTFEWSEADQTARQQIRVDSAGDALSYRWRIRTGVRPVAGTRTIAGEALDEAVIHNPWYRAGDSHQADATSFCMSRRVLASLRGGQATPLTLLGKLEDEDDPTARPIEWQGSLQPLGKATRTVTINGKPCPVSILRFKAGEAESAVMDDGLWPVGMADRLVAVDTAIRGRVVDRDGLGYAGVTIEMARDPDEDAPEPELSVTTWPDGRFRLPPAPPGGYRMVQVVVKHEQQELLRKNVDLSAQGLDELTLRVERARRELRFIHPGYADALDELKLPAQAVRHAKATLQAGLSIMIPDRTVQVNGTDAVAFYALDRASGDITAVMDDGLHGSSSPQREAWKAAILSAAESARKAKGKLGNLGAVHMIRGANTAWWTYCSHRLEGAGHGEAIMATLAEMEQWEKATNILKNFGEVAGEKAQKKLSDLLGGGGFNMDDDGAEAAFKIGYICSLAYLAVELDGTE